MTTMVRFYFLRHVALLNRKTGLVKYVSNLPSVLMFCVCVYCGIRANGELLRNWQFSIHSPRTSDLFQPSPSFQSSKDRHHMSYEGHMNQNCLQILERWI